jgi:gluconokinase
MKVPKSPYASIQGIVYFPRMLDKIRLFAAGELREDLHENLGSGFDERCCNFLQVPYGKIVAKVKEGLTDEQVLEWCFEQGFRPTEEQIEVWSDFMRKRGWNDEVAGRLASRIAESGFQNRDDIVVMFDYIDADEGRPTGGKAVA